MEVLLKLIIDDALVFASCSDEQIEPDFAIEQLERIAAALNSLDPATRSAFVDAVNSEALRAANFGDNALAMQLRNLPEHLGLV